MVTGTLAHWPCVQIERDHVKVCYEYLNTYLHTHTHTWVLTQVVSCMNTYKHTLTPVDTCTVPTAHSYCNSRGPPDVQTEETFIQMHKHAEEHTLAHLHAWHVEQSFWLYAHSLHPSVFTYTHTNTHMHHEERWSMVSVVSFGISKGLLLGNKRSFSTRSDRMEMDWEMEGVL